MTLEITGTNFTLLGHGTTLRHVTSSVSGTNVRIEAVRFVDPGWDGLYARGAVGLSLKGCVFDRPYRNGISVIDAVDMLVEDCTFSNSWPNGTGRVSPMASEGSQHGPPKKGPCFLLDHAASRLARCVSFCLCLCPSAPLVPSTLAHGGASAGSDAADADSSRHPPTTARPLHRPAWTSSRTAPRTGSPTSRSGGATPSTTAGQGSRCFRVR